MTVATTANKITYLGNGATVNFNFSFAADVASDIQVFITDSTGSVTQLSPTLYTVVINAAVAPNPTPVGGTVTYPISGSPLAAPNLLTILRTKPLVQGDAYTNQGTLYPDTIESGMDDLTMMIQQLGEQIGRQITVAVSDPAPANLPAVAQRKLQWAAFDANGNMIPASAPGGAVPISAAMQPVVAAATLALARTAMGLGAIATEGIGAGLQDDGAGNLRVFANIVADSTNQSVTSGFHTTERYASNAITYTFPLASTLFNGFFVDITATTNPVTLAINVADAFLGAGTGQSLILPPGSSVRVSTNAAGTWFVQGLSQAGMDYARNMSFTASVASNQLTVALKDQNGNDPSKSSPVVVAFRDPTATTGTPVIRVQTGSLSVVAPNGASFGGINNGPQRVWVVLFDNAGSLVLALYSSVTYVGGFPAAISGFPAFRGASATAIGAGSTSAGVFYGSSGVTTKAFRVLGFIDFDAGQATAGTWATAPSALTLWTPDIPLPGVVVKSARAVNGSMSTGANNIPADNTTPQQSETNIFITQAFASFNPVNMVKVEAELYLSNNTTTRLSAGIWRDANANVDAIGTANNANANVNGGASVKWQWIPGVTSSITYKAGGGCSGGTTTINGENGVALYNGTFASYLEVAEVMV